MFLAMIFDLDGTLVQTERLKAISYAKAIMELCPETISEETILGAFMEVVGRSRNEVAKHLLQRFGIEDEASKHMPEFKVSEPWQAFVQIRMKYYKAMIADPKTLREHQWPHTMALLEEARRSRCKLALATMSSCEQVQRILEILDLQDAFDFVATRDDVELGKPHPEIYSLLAGELDVKPTECLVIEDSPSGVTAALAAGMWCIAVSTPFTQKALHAAGLLETEWIVDDPENLPDVVRGLSAEVVEQGKDK